ncbi:MAG: HAMP domain-containing histidine kinase [Clostridiales bacterium]|nr:HAMP domain-containing histidine kinase [Clostridiales bacterium]
MCNAYPYFRERAEENIEASRAKIDAEVQEAKLFHVDEEFERYLLSSIYYMNYETTPNMDAYAYFTQNYDTDRLSGDEQSSIREAANRLMKNMRNQYTTVQSMNEYSSYASGVDKDFGSQTGLQGIIHGEEGASDYYQSWLVISYDSRGVPKVHSSQNIEMDESQLIGYLQQASMSRLMQDNGMDDYEYMEVTYEDMETSYAEEAVSESYELEINYDKALRNNEVLKQLPIPRIQNAMFAFGIYRDDTADEFWQDYWTEREAYASSGYMVGVLAIMAVMAVLALILQNVPVLALRSKGIFRLPTELVAVLGIWGAGMTAWGATETCIWSLKRGTEGIVGDMQSVGFGDMSAQAAIGFIFLAWTAFAFFWYWITASLLPYVTHPIRTLKEHMLCVSVCRWLKGLWLRIYHWATDIQVDEKLSRHIWKLVGLNGIVVAFLCCIWFGGVVGAVIYSGILYVLLKKKCGQIQEDYQKLLHVTRAIAKGDLNTPTDEDMGILNPIRDELTEIQSGFRKAVDEEVRSRNMKAELITNVSHDLKTPLTAIITYVDLLKKEDITEEERKEYIDTLERKSQRLKVLIEDLFEVSKATTNNITMNFAEVDLVNLIKQVRLENEDRIAESTLDMRWNLPEEKCILSLDPQRTFRIIDNLVQNILKYSMPHSRVYIEMKAGEDEVTVSFKNMSAAEMNFSADEITERFVRGDMSRNTEGSGLGLAIAQSFTELQNGTFKVEVDGDLFKVILSWKK